jgi:cysteine synthase A
MGIGLAQTCAYFGLRLICVVDPKATSQNLRILEAYGAQIEPVTEPDPITGDFLQARINRVQTLLGSIENSFWTNQYANRNNPLAHYQTTMPEIVTALDGKVDCFFCAISTCGTTRGCAEYIRDHDLKTKVFAVDAVGSVIFGGKRGKRLIPGHGAGIEPPLCQNDLIDLIDECIYVSDLDCVVGCRRLVRREAILAGGSSGGVLMALEKVRYKISPDATCVALLPDHGGRYLDTIYSDTWVGEHFGDVSHLWQD